MITSKQLLENGYKRFDKNFFCQYAKCFYQKKFTDVKGIKYFIEFYEYEKAWEIEMHTEKKEYCINTRIYSLSNKVKLKDIEDELDLMWKYHGSNYYEVINE